MKAELYLEKKIVFKVLASVFLLFSFTSVNASTPTCYSTGCSNVKVEMLYVEADRNILVGTDGDESVMNCDSASNGYATLLSTDSNFEIMYSTLLAARMSGQSVRIRIDENSAQCSVAYLVLED